MGQLIYGKSIAQKINDQTAARVTALKQACITPKLAVVLVGDDPASRTYVKNKWKAAAQVGLEFALHEIDGLISTEALREQIFNLQQDDALSGLIVQLPLPNQVNINAVLAAINPELDVDCLTDRNLGKLVMNTHDIVPPTPGAVISILEHLKVNLIGKNITIIGVGPLVGKPLAIMMMNARASVTTCNSRTKDTKEKCLAADIIVTCVGQKNVLCGDMVREGTIVIDTGVDFVDGRMYGDVNLDEVLKKAAWMTPTPGGVGPVTVARLLWNTVLCAQTRYDK